jgi:hypothetical protein
MELAWQWAVGLRFAIRQAETATVPSLGRFGRGGVTRQTCANGRCRGRDRSEIRGEDQAAREHLSLSTTASTVAAVALLVVGTVCTPGR